MCLFCEEDWTSDPHSKLWLEDHEDVSANSGVHQPCLLVLLRKPLILQGEKKKIKEETKWGIHLDLGAVLLLGGCTVLQEEVDCPPASTSSLACWNISWKVTSLPFLLQVWITLVSSAFPNEPFVADSVSQWIECPRILPQRSSVANPLGIWFVQGAERHPCHCPSDCACKSVPSANEYFNCKLEITHWWWFLHFFPALRGCCVLWHLTSVPWWWGWWVFWDAEDVL